MSPAVPHGLSGTQIAKALERAGFGARPTGPWTTSPSTSNSPEVPTRCRP